MKSLVTTMTLMLLLVSGLMPTAAVGSQTVDCAAIEGYLEDVDTLMVEHVHALVTRPGWAEDARDATILMNMGGSDVSASETESMIELLTIPGDVLFGLDEDAVPEDALALHESALRFWTTFPDRAAASTGDDQKAWESSFAVLGTASQDNLDALDAIDEACSGLLDTFLENASSIGALFDTLESEDGDPDAWTNATLEDLEGIGVFFLVMPGNLGGALTQPAPVAPIGTPDSTPAIVNGESDSTPGS